MGLIADRIDRARRHVELGRIAIARQREMVERHRAEGRDPGPPRASFRCPNVHGRFSSATWPNWERAGAKVERDRIYTAFGSWRTSTVAPDIYPLSG